MFLQWKTGIYHDTITTMKEVYKTADIIKISYIQSLLGDENIESYVMDEHTSAFYAGALMPRRVMVHDNDFSKATHILKTSDVD